MPALNSSSSLPVQYPADRRRRVVDAGGGDTADDPGLLSGAVSFRVRRLEPLLAWVIAGYTLWVNVLLIPAGAAVWLMALFSASIGGWAGMFPARHQAAMLVRGALLVLGVLPLHLAAGSGGATGPYFFLLIFITVFYALLLSRTWAAGLTLLAMVEFSVACWLAPESLHWQQGWAYAGFLGLIAPLTIVFSRSMRQSDEKRESALRDNRTLLYNETGFFVHGAELLAECRRHERPFSMVLLNGSDLRDIPDLLGRKVANDLFTQAVQAIGAVPGEGIAARIDSVEFALLLPGVTAERARALVQQRLGSPPKLEVKLDAKSVVILLDMAIAQDADKTQSIEQIYDLLHLRWVAQPTSGTPRNMPVLGPDDDRIASGRRDASPTVPMPLPPHLRPPKK